MLGTFHERSDATATKVLDGAGVGEKVFIQNSWIRFGNSEKSAMRQCSLQTSGPCLQDQSPSEISHYWKNSHSGSTPAHKGGSDRPWTSTPWIQGSCFLQTPELNQHLGRGATSHHEASSPVSAGPGVFHPLCGGCIPVGKWFCR